MNDLSNETGATANLLTQDPRTFGDSGTSPASEEAKSNDSDGGADMSVDNLNPHPSETGPPSGGPPVIAAIARSHSKRQNPPTNTPCLEIEDRHKSAAPII